MLNYPPFPNIRTTETVKNPDTYKPYFTLFLYFISMSTRVRSSVFRQAASARSKRMIMYKGYHTFFHHHYHLVWVTKYRFKVLRGAIRERVREIIRQVCEELGVTTNNGVLLTDHVHMFRVDPAHHAVSNAMRKVNGHSSPSYIEFPELKERYWGRHFWASGELLFYTRDGAERYHTTVH